MSHVSYGQKLLSICTQAKNWMDPFELQYDFDLQQHLHVPEQGLAEALV